MIKYRVIIIYVVIRIILAEKTDETMMFYDELGYKAECKVCGKKT